MEDHGETIIRIIRKTAWSSCIIDRDEDWIFAASLAEQNVLEKLLAACKRAPLSLFLNVLLFCAPSLGA